MNFSISFPGFLWSVDSNLSASSLNWLMVFVNLDSAESFDCLFLTKFLSLVKVCLFLFILRWAPCKIRRPTVIIGRIIFLFAIDYSLFFSPLISNKHNMNTTFKLGGTFSGSEWYEVMKATDLLFSFGPALLWASSPVAGQRKVVPRERGPFQR